jgi:pimeloyl-ACP methyl ester carboxylesterase
MFVFGNSSGAVIALDMAKAQPLAVRAVVVHEPPIPRVHPQNKKWFFHEHAGRMGRHIAQCLAQSGRINQSRPTQQSPERIVVDLRAFLVSSDAF